jgi:hypothetical protein
MLNLTVNNRKITSNLSDWTLRFVEGEESHPVLYYLGKRVTERWSLELQYDSLPDKSSNVNTAEIPEVYIYNVLKDGVILDTFDTLLAAREFCLGKFGVVIEKTEIDTSMDWTR